MFFRHFFASPLLLIFLVGCSSAELPEHRKLVIGVVSYGEGGNTVERYAALKAHLEGQLKGIVEIEPAYNEIQALQQIDRKVWDIVFAPPGLAAIAISKDQYLPLLARSGGDSERSVIVVRRDSQISQIKGLAHKTVALGQEGSATSYYLPIYNLYGLTLKGFRFAPTPRMTLEWVNKGEVDAGALSVAELNQYRTDFSPTQFRILYQDTHRIPSGAVLIGPTIERNEQEQILRALNAAPASVATAASYLPNAELPDYGYLTKVVKQVQPIAKRIKQSPAPLF
jgi:phosphonate transport system substrate-binding protein